MDRKKFLSTPSARRATHNNFAQRVPVLISIHALREEGDNMQSPARQSREISIHALREEGDLAVTAQTCSSSYFYPRPPRGGRPVLWIGRYYQVLFLSTPSARRATGAVIQFFFDRIFLSTPSARRATRRRGRGD